MATVKSSAENLTLNADGSGNDILFQSNGSQVGSLTAEGVLTATSFAGSGAALTGLSSFDPDGAVVFNESGADVDFRVESDSNAHAFFLQGSDGSIGMGTSTPVGDSAQTLHLADNIGIGFGSGANNRPDFQIRSVDGVRLGFICGEGSATEDIVMHTSGVLSVPQGIELGSGIDNTAANRLDDYEEGTWTPVYAIVGGGSHSSVSAQNNGIYTKVGRMCTIGIESYIVQTSGTITYYTVTLPFTAASGGAAFTGMGHEFAQTGNGLQIKISNSGTTMQIREYDGTPPAGNAYFDLGITYQTA